MPTSTEPVLSSNETKLLYTLLDAAHDEGRLRQTPFEARWLEIQKQAVAFPFLHRPTLYRLVEELDAAGLLHRTWMRERWLVVKTRVEREPMEFPASQAPFPTEKRG